jgi:hypothetical protein
MSPLLEFDCQVPVGGYEVITVEKPYTEDDDTLTLGGVVVGVEKWRILQPRSERTRRFDLFKANSSAFLEFAQTPATEDGIKAFADRYGPLFPDRPEGFHSYGRHIDRWFRPIRSMHQLVELWKVSRRTGDFSKITRAVRAVQIGVLETDFELGMEFLEFFKPAAQIELFLKEDPLSGSPRLCIRPRNLAQALWAQLLMAIDGNVNSGACVQCRKWFTLEAGRGRSDKEYCSNACRMRAYRKRKVSG